MKNADKFLNDDTCDDPYYKTLKTINFNVSDLKHAIKIKDKLDG